MMSSAAGLWTFKRIGTRLGACFAVVIGIMLAMAAVAVMQLRHIEALNEQAVHNADQMGMVQQWSGLVRTNLDRALTATRLDAAAGDDAAVRDRLQPVQSRLAEDMANTVAGTLEVQDKIKALIRDEAITNLMAEVEKQRVRFVNVRAEVRDDIQMGEGGPRIDKELMPLAGAMLKSLDTLEARLSSESSAAHAELKTKVAQAVVVLVTSSAAALAVAALLAWLSTRAITAPMRDAVSVAEHIANGDLTMTIATERPDEFGSLLRRLERMQQQLHTTFGDVRHSADSILVASSEVAAGNNDLSQRTEQTASSLQETASALERLVGNVNHSAASAHDADALVKSAAEVAAQGGEAVGRVVSTMTDISASAHQISEIIGVIDGIAFQTNILALNAAVEAARAGEQGRGFAVVASEVRALAHRSAEAAKQIKKLIAASAERVEQGSRLVTEAGSTMAQLVDRVGRVRQVVGEITARSGDQSKDLQEVNSAVNHIDAMTQQNAALVEQSAAAAQSLNAQARSLADALSVFRLQVSQMAQVAAPSDATAATTQPTMLMAPS